MSELKTDLIDLNFKSVLAECRKKWYWIATSVVVCLAFGIVGTLLIKPKYTAMATVGLVEENSMANFVGAGLSGLAQMFGGNSITDDEILILTSNTNLRRTVNDLGLSVSYYDHPMPLVNLRRISENPLSLTFDDSTINVDTLRQKLLFKVKVDKSHKADIKVLTGVGDKLFNKNDMPLPAKITTSYGTFILAATEYLKKNEPTTMRIVVASPVIAANELQEQIIVETATRASQILNISMTSDNEQYAIDVLNTTINNYAKDAIDFKKNHYGATAKFIDERINALRLNLNNIESSIRNYKKGEGLGMLEADGQVIYERMAEAEKALTEQEVLTEMAQIILQLARESAKDNSLIPPVTSNENIASLVESYNTMIMRRMTMSSSAKTDNLSLARIDEQINLLRGNIIAALESSVKSSKEIEDQLRKTYNRAKGMIKGIPSYEFELRQVERDREIEEQIYVFLLQKQEETNVFFNNSTPNIRIIDYAYSLSEDESVSPAFIIIFALLVGFMIPPMWFSLKYLINRPNTTYDEV